MTQTSHVGSLDATVHETGGWLGELEEALGGDREAAYDALGGTVDDVLDRIQEAERVGSGAT